MEVKYRIEGMHCGSCVDKIEAVFQPIADKVEVSLTPPQLKLKGKKAISLEEANQIIANAGTYRLMPLTEESSSQASSENQSFLKSYYPIFLIASYILVISLLNNIHFLKLDAQGFMNQFMAGFFLVFSAFKLLDIKGFAEGYATYDLLARRWHSYGLIYPFLELSLGLLYLLQWQPTFTLIYTFILMSFSSLGVINALMKKQAIHCACLGTILKVPLSSITLIEDLAMVVLALLSLVMR